MRLIGMLVCKVMGKHRRGKRVRVLGALDKIVCPRCGESKGAPRAAKPANQNAKS